MKVEFWPLAEIRAHEKNPCINDAAVDAGAQSIRQFGFRVPLIVDGDGVLIAGRTRLPSTGSPRTPRTELSPSVRLPAGVRSLLSR